MLHLARWLAGIIRTKRRREFFLKKKKRDPVDATLLPVLALWLGLMPFTLGERNQFVGYVQAVFGRAERERADRERGCWDKKACPTGCLYFGEYSKASFLSISSCSLCEALLALLLSDVMSPFSV